MYANAFLCIRNIQNPKLTFSIAKMHILDALVFISVKTNASANVSTCMANVAGMLHTHQIIAICIRYSVGGGGE